MGLAFFSGDCECICQDLSLLGYLSWVVHRTVKKRPWFAAFSCFCIQLFQPCQVCYYNLQTVEVVLKVTRPTCAWGRFKENNHVFPQRTICSVSVGKMLPFNMKSFIYCASNLLLWCTFFLEAHMVKKVSSIQMWFGMTWELHCFAIIVFSSRTILRWPVWAFSVVLTVW